MGAEDLEGIQILTTEQLLERLEQERPGSPADLQMRREHNIKSDAYWLAKRTGRTFEQARAEYKAYRPRPTYKRRNLTPAQQLNIAIKAAQRKETI